MANDDFSDSNPVTYTDLRQQLERVAELEDELADARRTAQYWKANHLAGEKLIEELRGDREQLLSVVAELRERRHQMSKDEGARLSDAQIEQAAKCIAMRVWGMSAINGPLAGNIGAGLRDAEREGHLQTRAELAQAQKAATDGR